MLMCVIMYFHICVCFCFVFVALLRNSLDKWRARTTYPYVASQRFWSTPHALIPLNNVVHYIVL